MERSPPLLDQDNDEPRPSLLGRRLVKDIWTTMSSRAYTRS